MLYNQRQRRNPRGISPTALEILLLWLTVLKIGLARPIRLVKYVAYSDIFKQRYPRARGLLQLEEGQIGFARPKRRCIVYVWASWTGLGVTSTIAGHSEACYGTTPKSRLPKMGWAAPLFDSCERGGGIKRQILRDGFFKTRSHSMARRDASHDGLAAQYNARTTTS
jgi:hypothetical protein